VRAAGDTPVANHIYPVANSIDDLSELIERASRPVQLAPAVIGYYDAACTNVDGTLGVGNAHDALEAELFAPTFCRPAYYGKDAVAYFHKTDIRSELLMSESLPTESATLMAGQVLSGTN
jgi:hypothetical protein